MARGHGSLGRLPLVARLGWAERGGNVARPASFLLLLLGAGWEVRRPAAYQALGPWGRHAPPTGGNLQIWRQFFDLAPMGVEIFLGGCSLRRSGSCGGLLRWVVGLVSALFLGVGW